MGKHFGNLQKLKGVTYYVLSPNELNPFCMMFNPGFKNLMRRSAGVITQAFIPVSTGVFVYYWGNTTFKQSKRKNPDDYKDDI